MTYDLADRHLSTTSGGQTVTYTRDATDRIITRTANGVTLRYSYSGSGDAADMVMTTTNDVVDKMVDLIGGVTKNTHKEANVYSDKYSYPNIHGDTLMTADGGGTKQGPTLSYDPFGQALTTLVDNLTGEADLGWLGSKDRLTEHMGSVQTIEMGQRQYVPGLGRFIEVDPVEGGSANDYDYCDGEPIGCFDIAGTWSVKKFWKKHGGTIATVLGGAALIAGATACAICALGLGAAAFGASSVNAGMKAKAGDWKGAGLDAAGALPFGNGLRIAKGLKGAQKAFAGAPKGVVGMSRHNKKIRSKAVQSYRKYYRQETLNRVGDSALWGASAIQWQAEQTRR